MVAEMTRVPRSTTRQNMFRFVAVRAFNDDCHWPSTSDATIQVSPALKMSLEQYLTFIGPDELLEVTPHHLRLRKKDLNFKR